MEQPEQNESRLLLFLQRHKDARRRPPASEHENRHAVTFFFFLFSQEVIQNLRSYNSPKDVDDEHVHIYDAQVC